MLHQPEERLYSSLLDYRREIFRTVNYTSYTDGFYRLWVINQLHACAISHLELELDQPVDGASTDTIQCARRVLFALRDFFLL